MSKIYTIRHAETQLVPNISSVDWELSNGATESVKHMLRDITFDDIRCIYHSPLIKAEATAKIISEIYGFEIRANECLREVERYFGFVSEETFRRRVNNYLSGFDSNHFERYDSAKERIITCIKNLVKESGGESFMVVSHGMILTILYSYLVGFTPAFVNWQKLKMPDLSIIDIEKEIIERGFYSGNSVVGQIV